MLIRKKMVMEIVSVAYLLICAGTISVILWRHFNRKPQKEDKPAEGDKTDEAIGKEELQYTLDTVNSWVNNCDQKAGILLTVVGVAVTVIMTSDFVKYLRQYIFAPFVDYCQGNNQLLFSCGRFVVFVLLSVVCAMLITTFYYLLKVISANIDYKKMYDDNPGLEKTSYIFYGTISGMKFDSFKQRGIKFENDLKSQIYVNSRIATAKFVNYNDGMFWFKLMLLVAAMLFVAVMFVK